MSKPWTAHTGSAALVLCAAACTLKPVGLSTCYDTQTEKHNCTHRDKLQSLRTSCSLLVPTKCTLHAIECRHHHLRAHVLCCRQLGGLWERLEGCRQELTITTERLETELKLMERIRDELNTSKANVSDEASVVRARSTHVHA